LRTITNEKVADSAGSVPDTTQNRPITNDCGRLRTNPNEKVSDSAGSVPDTGEKVSDTPDIVRSRPIAADCGRLRPITADPERLDPEEARILIFLLDQGKISRREVMELLGLGATKVKDLLSSLTENNLILRRGQGRSTYYVLAQPPQGASDV
jgi:ATP-dependent DNA helicase RecG